MSLTLDTQLTLNDSQQRLFTPVLDQVEEMVRECVLKAADQGLPIDRIVGAGGGSSSPYTMRRLKEITRPSNIYTDPRHRHLVADKYNNWKVDKDSLLTVLKGGVLCRKYWCYTSLSLTHTLSPSLSITKSSSNTHNISLNETE